MEKNQEKVKNTYFCAQFTVAFIKQALLQWTINWVHNKSGNIFMNRNGKQKIINIHLFKVLRKEFFIYKYIYFYTMTASLLNGFIKEFDAEKK